MQSPHAESVCKATHKLLEALQLLEQEPAGRAGRAETEAGAGAGAETEGPAGAGAAAEAEATAQGAAVPWGTVIDVGAAPGG